MRQRSDLPRDFPDDNAVAMYLGRVMAVVGPELQSMEAIGRVSQAVSEALWGLRNNCAWTTQAMERRFVEAAERRRERLRKITSPAAG